MVTAFGQDILNPDETINRDKLGEMVFGNSEQLTRLNHITHPRIMESFKEDTTKDQSRESRGHLGVRSTLAV
jgi:dephospho-CoA kinase